MMWKTRFSLLALSFVGVCAITRWSQAFLGEGAILVGLALLGVWIWTVCSVEPQRLSSHFDGPGAEDAWKD